MAERWHQGATRWHRLAGLLLLWASGVSGLLSPHQTQAEPLPQMLRIVPDSPHGQAILREAWTYFLAQPGVPTGPAQEPVRLVVVFDPDCPYCHDLWLGLQHAGTSEIRIRWVPVAFVRPATLNKAAAIISAPDPAKALTLNETHFDSVHHEGGLLPLYTVAPGLAEAIRGSTRRWRTLVGLLPAMLYRKPGERVVKIIAGVPPRVRLDALMTALGGKPVSGLAAGASP